MNKIEMSTNEQIYKKKPNRILELKNIRTGLEKKQNYYEVSTADLD